MAERLDRLPANARERGHVAATRAILAGDHERARTLLGDVLHMTLAHAIERIRRPTRAVSA